MKPDEVPDVKKFITTSLYFILFFILISIAITALPLKVFYNYKENYKVNKSISEQFNNNSIVVGYSLSEEKELYKLNMINIKQPELLILGSSRMMQISCDHFDKSCYNAGGIITVAKDYNLVLDRIETLPEIVIISLAPNYFNTNNPYKQTIEKKLKEKYGILTFRDSIMLTYRYLLTKNLSINYKNNIGLNGIINNQGYRFDGTYQYKTKTHNNFSKSLNYIKNDKDIFTRGDFDIEFFKDFEKFIIRLNNQNIKIIGIIPPVATVVYTELNKERESYGHIFDQDQYLKSLLQYENFEYYDFFDINSHGFSDDHCIDGLHLNSTYSDYMINHIKSAKIGTFI